MAPVEHCQVDGIPNDYNVFADSNCYRLSSPREVQISCTKPVIGAQDDLRKAGMTRCALGRTCLDPTVGGPPTAICAFGNSFERLVTGSVPNNIQTSHFSGFLSFSRSTNDIEIILESAVQPDTLYYAHWIAIVPTRRSWGNLIEPAMCSHCASLALRGIPHGPFSFDLHVFMRRDFDLAMLKGFIYPRWRNFRKR